MLGDRKEEVYVLGAIEKKLCVWGIKEVRVNRRVVISFSRMGKLSSESLTIESSSR